MPVSADASKAVDPTLEVRSEVSATPGRARQFRWAWVVALVVLIGSSVWWGWQSYSEMGGDHTLTMGESALPSSEETVSGTSADSQAETSSFTLTPLDSIDMEVESSASDETLDDFERGQEAYFRGDYLDAMRWLRKAAEHGHAGAQLLLGMMYGSGEGVVQDTAEAARWYRKAAEQRLAEAQRRLGLMYGSGVGVAQDYVAAYMWLNIATSTGAADQVVNAREWRDLAAAGMK